MTIEILNIFTEVDGFWSYKGQFQWGGNWIPLSGKIEKIKSKDRLKRMLKSQVENYIRKYIDEHQPVKTLTIPEGGVFVSALS
jgi:hypothetical protein